MWYGPQSQTGLICTSPPSRNKTPATANKSPSERGACPGKAGTPTIFRSVCRGPLRNCVWCFIATSARCTVSSTAISAGSRNTCAMYIREKKSCLPGKGPSQISEDTLAPTNGIDIDTPYAIASPIPESRSSTIE